MQRTAVGPRASLPVGARPAEVREFLSLQQDVIEEVTQHDRPGDSYGDVQDTTCPICVEDFVEGDVIRELPCPGRHRYHSHCVDEWLLQHSVCPLCRQDFGRQVLSPQSRPGTQGSQETALSTQQTEHMRSQANEGARIAETPRRARAEWGASVPGSDDVPPPPSAPNHLPARPTNWALAKRFEEYRRKRRTRRGQTLADENSRDQGGWQAEGTQSVSAVAAESNSAIPGRLILVERWRADSTAVRLSPGDGTLRVA
ncbi:unnamed protein product [Jaminaea pallidilutea]